MWGNREKEQFQKVKPNLKCGSKGTGSQTVITHEKHHCVVNVFRFLKIRKEFDQILVSVLESVDLVVDESIENDGELVVVTVGVVELPHVPWDKFF